MNLNEFMEKVQNGIKEFMGNAAQVEIKEVMKNNGVVLQGIIIRKDEELVAPTIYLNSFYEEFVKGKGLGDIVSEVIQIYEQNQVKCGVNMDFFLDYETVRGRIFQKVIHYEKNKKQLENVPHFKILDLAVVCYYAYMNDFLGQGAIQIDTSHLDRWGISEEELFGDAKRNTAEKLGLEMLSMHDMLLELVSTHLSEEEIELLQEMNMIPKQEIPMYVMTLRGRYFGAACLCHTEMLQAFAEKCGGNFYILPSSIHEVIVVPDSGKEQPEELRNMVSEVNAGHVALEEQLSDNVYYFDISEHQLFII